MQEAASVELSLLVICMEGKYHTANKRVTRLKGQVREEVSRDVEKPEK